MIMIRCIKQFAKAAFMVLAVCAAIAFFYVLGVLAAAMRVR